VQHAPERVPLICDMVDVDSEKFADYSRRRRPSWLFAVESRRLRNIELTACSRSSAVLLTTAAEKKMLQTFARNANIRVMENGIDTGYFHPNAGIRPDRFHEHDYAVFTGVMDYPPNVEAVVWFARQVLPETRRSRPEFKFIIVGRSPSSEVRSLQTSPGVVVTGTVPDVRPYLRDATVAVAPLFLARGIQNKVLEALAMGKRVLASQAVAGTFGQSLPLGLCRCDTPLDYVRELTNPSTPSESSIRADVAERFRWRDKLNVIDEELSRVFDRTLAAAK
jgi:polysaccharide biosynthesis protein PslH